MAGEAEFSWAKGKSPADLKRRLGGLRISLGKAMLKGLGRIGGEWERRMKGSLRDHAYRGGGGSKMGFNQRVGNRSGTLSSSLGYVVEPNDIDDVGEFANVNAYEGVLDDARVVLRSDMAAPFNYALTHEKPGVTVVRPKRGKYLTIPLPAALNPSGTLKQSARAYEDSFVLRSKKGNLLIVRTKGNGEIEPLFVLKEQVTIPGNRLGFRATARELVEGDYAKDVLVEAARRVLLDFKGVKV